jgi:hypothetical protein
VDSVGGLGDAGDPKKQMEGVDSEFSVKGEQFGEGLGRWAPAGGGGRVFHDRWGEFEEVPTPHTFQRFGDTLGAMYDLFTGGGVILKLDLDLRSPRGLKREMELEMNGIPRCQRPCPNFPSPVVVASVFKLDIMILEAICAFDMATDLVNDDDWVVSRKGELDGGTSGVTDLLTSRGLSGWS